MCQFLKVLGHQGSAMSWAPAPARESLLPTPSTTTLFLSLSKQCLMMENSSLFCL